MSALPAFRLNASDLSGDEAFEAWREIMARMFHIERIDEDRGLPRGGMSAFLLGEILGNRSNFNAQRLTRDRRRVEATPDHLVFQMYRSGGFFGEMGGTPVRIARGQIAICDLRRPLDVQAMTSATIGLSIPRHLLDGIDLDRLPPRLDPARERLLAARITSLHCSLAEITALEAPAAVDDILAVLRRLLDPSQAVDVLETHDLDADLFTLADQIIAGTLSAPDISAETIAERLQVSRATLYRVFAPVGGVMQHVWTKRLEAVRAALDQPSRPHTLARLATDHGFKTASHLSRSFRARYGIAPRDWRKQQSERASNAWTDEAARLNACWRGLGRAGR